MRDILILTDYRGLYRQGINRNKGIDIQKVRKIFEENAYQVEMRTYDEIVNQVGIHNITDKFIFYTSSQVDEYRSYIDDIIYELGKSNTLIPRYDLIKCHENKCYEEILANSVGIHSLHSWVFSNYRDMLKHTDEFHYPLIVKCSTGSGSISVFKADEKKRLEKIVKRVGKGKSFYEFYLKYLYKKCKGKLSPEYALDEKYFRKYIVQQFVPNLTEDWKVLAFGDKFYVLNRKVRDNDFRASGSGKFSYIEPPKSILDSAKNIYEKLDVPFLSMDLCMDERHKVYLIEFQGLHFGPYTLMNSEEYYTYKDGEWEKFVAKSDLAEEYANAVLVYLEQHAGRE